MTGPLDRDEPTPVLPAAPPPPPGTPLPATAAPPPAPPADVPPSGSRAGSSTLWRIAVAACAGSLAATVLGLAAPADRRPERAAARAAPVPPQAGEAVAPPALPGEPRPAARPAPRRPARAGARPAPAARTPAHSAREDPLAAARALYLVGDLGAARAAVAALREPEATALSARLGAIAEIVGGGGRWPPPRGAAALERLLELDAAVAGERGSPLADRARSALADHLAAKGRGLADEGRWEEALGAFREAARRKPDHPGAAAGLARAEAVAEGLYLEGYAVEEADPASAERLYRRAARLARPDGRVAPRIAARLVRLPRL